MVKEFSRRREKVFQLLKQLPGIQCAKPDGAFYIFPTIRSYFGRSDGQETISNADELCMYLLNKAHVSTVTGRAFGNNDCIRISFANSMENIEKGFERIIEALGRLK